ncbi:kelch-like protein 41b [Arctopsyche grandis]|uniref:kelch-like protein 41b n=1 Tax=Arctopsyche grandis TaxID=121162 RepID=UPI00406D6E74
MIEVKAKRNFATNQLERFYNTMVEQKYTDGIFVVRNRSYVVHMLVLSACSDFFRKNEYNLSAIFSDFDDIIIDAILKYCYTGKTTIDEKYYEKFKELANKLEIKSIAPQYKTIEQTNCLEVLRFSDEPTMIEKAMELALKHFDILYKTPEFLSLPALVLADILKSDDLNVYSEEDVFNSVKLWVNFDKTNRRNELAGLLSFVKLPLLSTEFIITEAMDICSSYPECVGILKQAMQPILSNYQCLLQKESLRRRSEKIALFGGGVSDVANTVDIYDARNESWTLSKSFQFNRHHFASVLINDWILIIGGTTAARTGDTSVDYIDLKNGEVHQLKPLNQARAWFPAVTLRRDSTTDVYAIGGKANTDISSSVERWNSKTKNWEMNVAPMLQALHIHSASVISGKIYVAGGRTSIGGKHQTINALQVYSVECNSWSYLAPMIQARDYHSSIAIRGKLYIAGGYRLETGTFLDSVESYDPDVNLWTSYCKMPNPRYGVNLCFYRNKLHCIGGHDGKAIQNNTWEYNDLTKNWKTLKSTNKVRAESFAHIIPHDSII